MIFVVMRLFLSLVPNSLLWNIYKYISDFKETSRELVLSNAFNAYTSDVITEYCFKFRYKHLESLRFKENFYRAFMAVSAFGHLAL